jgi:tryptophan-rich sensory protein
LLIQLVGAYFSSSASMEWYQQLIKPSWTPPDWIFPIVWPLLYLMMAISFWIIWTYQGQPHPKKGVFTIFFVQLALNMLWSPVFFTLKSPYYALVVIALLWLSLIATIFSFYRFSKLAAFLLIPYLLWVTYALTLNLGVWALN